MMMRVPVAVDKCDIPVYARLRGKSNTAPITIQGVVYAPKTIRFIRFCGRLVQVQNKDGRSAWSGYEGFYEIETLGNYEATESADLNTLPGLREKTEAPLMEPIPVHEELDNYES